MNSFCPHSLEIRSSWDFPTCFNFRDPYIINAIFIVFHANFQTLSCTPEWCACFKNVLLIFVLGDEEQAYWEKIKNDRKQKYEQKIRCNIRGKNKLMKKIEAVMVQNHIRFSD